LQRRSRRRPSWLIPSPVPCRTFRRYPSYRVYAPVLVIALFALMGHPEARAQTSPTHAQAAPAGVSTACTVAPRPNSLWSLAECCAKDLRSDRDCRYYNKADEFIILKDNSSKKPAAYLIIPTAKITGIDDQEIFAPPFVDFWSYAWQQAQTYLKKPAAETALAINSKPRRTQEQLHIHIACVRPDVAQALAQNDAKIGSDPATAWQTALGPNSNTYRVIKTSGLAAADSPYKLVAAMPGARTDMADQSIAVVGSTTPGSYYVLDTSAHGTNPGSAEELLDQYCGS
jgi:CDP-diacylglycerol pyrophosphatase